MKKKIFLNQYYKLFPRKFGNYWNRIKNSSNIDRDLNFITNNFINSKSHNLVSRYWHILGIRNYESLAEFGLKKYGDPNKGEIDFIDWIELIRFKETRNYVQRVIENINVYKYTLNKDPIKIDGFFRQ